MKTFPHLFPSVISSVMEAAHSFGKTARFRKEKQPPTPKKLLEIQTHTNINFAYVLC